MRTCSDRSSRRAISSSSSRIAQNLQRRLSCERGGQRMVPDRTKGEVYMTPSRSSWLRGYPATNDLPGALQCQRESVCHGCLRNNIKLQPKMYDGLRDLRPDATDNAIGTHQSGSRYGLDQVLGHHCVDRWHPGDIDDGDLSSGLHDVVEQVLHHLLSTLAVKGADQRKENDPLPELHYGSGKL